MEEVDLIASRSIRRVVVCTTNEPVAHRVAYTIHLDSLIYGVLRPTLVIWVIRIGDGSRRNIEQTIFDISTDIYILAHFRTKSIGCCVTCKTIERVA